MVAINRSLLITGSVALGAAGLALVLRDSADALARMSLVELAPRLNPTRQEITGMMRVALNRQEFARARGVSKSIRNIVRGEGGRPFEKFSARREEYNRRMDAVRVDSGYWYRFGLAYAVLTRVAPDPTGGSTLFVHPRSLDGLPAWSILKSEGGTAVHVAQFGNVPTRFSREHGAV